MKSQDTIPPAMSDLVLTVTFFLLICMSVMTFSKAQEAITVKVPEVAKQEEAVKSPQGLRQKRIILRKSGELLYESRPLLTSELGPAVNGASTIFLEADRDATLGRYIEVQEEISKAGVYDIRVLAMEKKI